MKNLLVGIGTATLLASGGAVTADQVMNPYQTVTITQDGTSVQVLKEDATSTIESAGVDSVLMDTTAPKVTLTKWNGEAQMGITYTGLAPDTTGARKALSKEVDWSDADQTMSVVPLDATSGMEDGGYEISITLNSEPKSNIFAFSIDGWQNMTFNYQPPLWQEAGLPGPTKSCTDNDCDWGFGQANRPVNVVGSYAVYGNHWDHVIGQTNYSSGKLFQVYRPTITDAKGNTVFGQLSYSQGVLTVTVPQTFLDTAIYPVVVDPIIGKSVVGGTTINNTAGTLTNISSQINNYTASTNDFVTKFSTWARDTSTNNSSVSMAVYTFVSLWPDSRVGSKSTITITSTTAQQWDSSAVSIALAGGTSYITAIGGIGANDVTLFYDATVGCRRYDIAGVDMPATWTQSGTDNFCFTQWATVTNIPPVPGSFHSKMINNKTNIPMNKGNWVIN